ncbi:MAG: T9SS type A sorting domain-containing protein [Candidatus Tenebribacter mawsonii]|jgi:hypothetical protein|nr:T9SS type A sorting domain-containing protein [Candidatus Tenebribacter mawsonii]
MKKTYLVLILTLITFSIYSQNYYPFPDSNAIWNDKSYWSPHTWIQRYGVYGDTTINNQLYNQLYLIEDDSTININNMTYYAAIRENDTKQIFVKLRDYDYEILIYDFSLNVGDTIISNSPNGYLNWGTCIITDIDTIEIENNHYRRRFKINNYGESEYWIEGIGSKGGLFFPISDYLTGTINDLLCFKHNDTAIYLNNPECDKCFCKLYTPIDELTRNTEYINVYPNPTKANIHIDFELEKGLSTIKLINFNGTLIESRITNSFPIQMNIENLPNGIYLIQLNTEKEIFTKKIIKTE